ncbi:MAG: hydantoinase B/oxoprolinase family protein [Dehalococcoidia bacterium]|jgi:N-methylhydantoinase B/acetone carboxylase alpha subunit
MGIGWNKKSLKEMLSESKVLFKETGHYMGLTELPLKESDPLKYERLFSRIRGTVVGARETALHISASPIVRELGELCFTLYSPEGDSLALSTGIIVHVHTMSEAIKWMIDNSYEEEVGLKEGDIFTNNDALIGDAHTSDVQSIIPVFYKGELIAWVGSVTHVMEIGGVDAGGIPITTTNRFGDGLYFSCEKVGENDKLYRTYQIRADRNLRGSTYWHLDEKARLAGCQIIRDNLKPIIDEFGVDYYKKFIREIIEEGRQVFKARVRERLFPGRYRAVSFYDKDMSMILANAQRMTHAPTEMTIGADGLFKLNMSGANKWSYDPGNSSLPAMQAGLWVAATQMLAYDGKVNDGAYYATEQHYPYGSWANPDWPYVSLSATWGPLMVTYNAVFRCIARSFFSRGFVEEIMAGYGITGLIQWGGTDQYGKPLGGINFELSASGSGARGVMDGIDTGYAMWNPESDMGNMEIWELAFPMIYLGRRITPDSGGLGKYRGGNAFHSIVMAWNSNNIQLADGGPGKAFNNAGIFGGYPGTPTLRKQVYCQNNNLADIFKNKQPYPSYEGDPRNYTFAKMLKGDLHIDDQTTLLPTDFKPYDIYLCFWNGGPGYGDPIERKLQLVEQDLNNGHSLAETAMSVSGVVSCQDGTSGEWKVDATKTAELRKKIKEDRSKRAIPARTWWQSEREKVIQKNIFKPIKEMYQESMAISPDWAEEYRKFWELPDDFTY